MKRTAITFLSTLLCLCIALGCAMPAFAAEGEDYEPYTEPAPEPMDAYITGDGSSYELTWIPADGAQYYDIYRASSRYGEYEKINAEPVADTTFTDSSASFDCCYQIVASIPGSEPLSSAPVSYSTQLFGENVYIFSPDDNEQLVQDITNGIYAKQQTAQFGRNRFALLFKPGEYHKGLNFQIGFYTHVAGLGMLPTDTQYGAINCTARWLGDNSNHNATCNFWRAIENITVNYDTMWAVSQATAMRRMQINGSLALHDMNGWASGGFLSDSVIEGYVDSGSQQQWLSRNNDWASWQGQNWNMVFVGLEEGDAPAGTWPETKYTTVDKTPIIAEKPFLVCENDSYGVFVPAVQTDTSGITWADGSTEGKLIDISEFYVAKAERDTADTINEALAAGKNLIFTPGIYQLNKTIRITNPDTVVLGLGLATIRPMQGQAAIEIADVDGVRVCGMLIDAGPEHTENLMVVGTGDCDVRHTENPIILSDMFFRVGGAWPGSTDVDCCITVNSNDVIGDNLWVWRADHGDAARSVGWAANVTKNGIIVNGDYVTMYALMVEHFHEYQTIWNGNYGRTYFYQSEIPYDVPWQEVWMSHDGERNGYASYKVSDNVTNHETWGLGIYSYHRDAVVDLHCAVEVPEVSGVKLHNTCAIMITGNPGISHVINDSGEASNTAGYRAIITEFGGEGFPDRLGGSALAWYWYAAIGAAAAAIAAVIAVVCAKKKKNNKAADEAVDETVEEAAEESAE